jgi:ABC-type sugar transport system ATPase subunit
MVIELIRKIRERGTPIIFISHNMPQVFDLADRILLRLLSGAARCS